MAWAGWRATQLLGTDVQPGRYRLWGRVYLQLWAAELALALAPLPVLSGSPLLSAYLRLLGADVGRNCHIATSAISLPSLVSIGEEASIGYGVQVRPWVVEDGHVVVEPVMIGDRAFVGAGSVLEPGSAICAGAMLAAQSSTGRGQIIGAGERWAGSPSAPSDRIDPALDEMDAVPWTRGWTRAQLGSVVARLARPETGASARPGDAAAPSTILLLENTPRRFSAYEVRYEGPGQATAVELTHRDFDLRSLFEGTPDP